MTAGPAIHLVFPRANARRATRGHPQRAWRRDCSGPAVVAAESTAHEWHLHGLAQRLRRRCSGAVCGQSKGPAFRLFAVRAP